MLQTLRYTARSLRRTPSFTIAALLCLALGIGATTTIFSIVNGVLLRPLPYPDSGRLVRIYTEFPTFPGGGLRKFWVSAPEVFDIKKAVKSFESVGASFTQSVNVAGLHQPARVTATAVSAEIPKLLEIKPLLGHLLTPAADTPGAPRVLMLSYGLWKRAFAGDPKIIGRQTY